MRSQHKDLTSLYKDLTKRHQDLPSQHNYLTRQKHVTIKTNHMTIPRRHTTLIQRCIDVDIWWRRRTTYFQRRYNVVKFDVEFRRCLNVESTSGLILKKNQN